MQHSETVKYIFSFGPGSRNDNYLVCELREVFIQSGQPHGIKAQVL